MNANTEIIYSTFLEHPVISTDSRQIHPGSIFFALKGESFDGNDFAEKALESGAVLAVTDDPRLENHAGCLLVGNALQTLQELALHHRNQFNIPVIAITGTNGKTTTKELTKAVVAERYNTLATQGNLNNHIGVPLTLLGITRETEIALIEMGANHPGEIGFLCRIACPGYGLITNVGKAHLEGFGGFEGVVRTKTELYRYLRENNGMVFLNQSDELLKEHAAGIKTVTYGEASSDILAANLQADPFVRMDLCFPGGIIEALKSNLYGLYNASNMLAAAAVGWHFGVSTDRIKAALESYQPSNNRSQLKQTPDNLLILDAYNANPSSMEVAIVHFAQSGYKSKTIILGDMLELGEESEREHLRILELAEKSGFDAIYLVGPVFTGISTRRENICFHDSDLARAWLEHHHITGSTILIKGSRGIKLERVAEVL